MKQKLIAAAVAGAFIAPAVAFAQNSSVQIYGTLNAEYGFAKGVNKAAGKTNTWDGLNSGASNIGFKGEEKLGGGMRAFFQCETDLGFLKGDSDATDGHASAENGWCGRNSAVGLKGGFGSFYIGTWDSPTKTAIGKTRQGGETGWLGVQGLLISNGAGFTGSFSARNANSINYNSPNFGGFSVDVQTTSTKEAATVTTAGLKGRATSISLDYAGGPLYAVASYTKVDDNRSKSQLNGTKDEVWTLGATYKIGKASLGLTYVNAEAQPAVGQQLERTSWNLGGSYDLAGPGSVFANYTVAGDTKTNQAGVVAQRGSSTGAKIWQIGYKHSLSKRSFAQLAYARSSQDSRATGYSVGTNHAGSNMNAGASSSVVVMTLNHKF